MFISVGGNSLTDAPTLRYGVLAHQRLPIIWRTNYVLRLSRDSKAKRKAPMFMDAFFLAAPDRLELTTNRLTADCSTYWAKGQCLAFYKAKIFNGCSNNLFSRTVASQVFSALVSLTTVFGMRTGGTSPLTSPQWYIHKVSLEHIFVSCTNHIVHFFYLPVNLFTR